MEFRISFPGVSRPHRFRVESADPAESLFTGVTKVTIIEPEPETPGEERTGYEDIGGLSRQLRELRELLEFPLRAPEALRGAGSLRVAACYCSVRPAPASL